MLFTDIMIAGYFYKIVLPNHIINIVADKVMYFCSHLPSFLQTMNSKLLFVNKSFTLKNFES